MDVTGDSIRPRAPQHAPGAGRVLKLFAAALSAGRQLLVLTYHRVLPQYDPLLPDEVDAVRFEQQIRFLAEHFRILPLTEAIARLHRASLPARSLCITMDDGYANNCEVALPILRRHGVTATCFVATGFVGSGLMWNDSVIDAIRRTSRTLLDLRAASLGSYPVESVAERRRAIDAVLASIKYLGPPERAARVEHIIAAAGVTPAASQMMNATQIRALHEAGIEIGAHTVSHPILARIADREARREIEESRAQLTDILRAPVRSFAYPNGRPDRDYGSAHVEMVRAAGFDLAVSTAWGPARVSCGPWQVPRLAPWDRSLPAFGVRLLRTYCQRSVGHVRSST